MTIGASEEEAKILSRIGSRVTFHHPAGEGDKTGTLVDRSVTRSTTPPGAVPYWDVVDWIEFPNERERRWIRIGYYRKPKGRLNWASQTTITEPVSIWRRILTTAAREKPWFRQLLEDVMNEVNRDTSAR